MYEGSAKNLIFYSLFSIFLLLICRKLIAFSLCGIYQNHNFIICSCTFFCKEFSKIFS